MNVNIKVIMYTMQKQQTDVRAKTFKILTIFHHAVNFTYLIRT